jgi:hypothetical protein
VIELPLLAYDASEYREHCRLVESYRNKVLTPLYHGQRIYVTECYLEGDANKGVLMAICEAAPCDCGKCARGECDPAQEFHYDGGYIRREHSTVSL